MKSGERAKKTREADKSEPSPEAVAGVKQVLATAGVVVLAVGLPIIILVSC